VPADAVSVPSVALRQDAPPRVLVIEPQGSGGIWHYAHSLSGALADAGFEVALCTTAPFESIDGDGRVPIWAIAGRPSRAGSALWRPWRRAANHVGKLRALRQVTAAFRPAIVHLHGPLGCLDVAYFRWLKRRHAGIVYTAHDARPLGGGMTWLGRARLREADAVFVHSSNGVAELLADGVDASRIVRIAHPAYLHLCRDAGLSRDEARRLLGLPTEARLVLFFGTIAPYKGLDTLLAAFARLRDEGGRASPRLLIAGEPLEDFAPYAGLIDRLRLRDHVRLDLRYIPFDDVARYFVACDVVALPYRRIYQSGVLQLAYGFGRPVVVTNVGGLVEAVAEDRTGVVATGCDAESVAAGLRQVLADAERAAEMGRRARRLAETKYSWRHAVGEIAGVYRRVRSASSWA
jgi:D-inositol-3-phosphate glycosyltransferase